MAPGPTRVVPLDKPLPVVIFHTTAVAEPGGPVGFVDDVYGLDAALERHWRRPALLGPASARAP